MRRFLPFLAVVALVAAACDSPVEPQPANRDLVAFDLMGDQGTGDPKGLVNAITPSTNEINLTNGWAHVTWVSDAPGQVTLNFVSLRGFLSCFEYRKDDGAPIGGVNPNPDVTDGRFNSNCQNNSTLEQLFTGIQDHIDIRMVFGAETDERFDWTRFYVEALPNDPPDADPNGPYLVAVDALLVFDGSGSSDPNGDNLTEAWDYGDGSADGTSQHTYDAPGIYTVCLTVTDPYGESDTECTIAVVYDPGAGFVTGGGWIDSHEGAFSGEPNLTWDQGFEADAAGWFDINSGGDGTVTRVASGTNGITSASGNWHAVFTGDTNSAPFSRFDGYRDVWPGSWTAEIDVYLDPAWAVGTGFDYSVAATGSDGGHQRDFIFHVTKDTNDGALYVAGSNNTNFDPREDLETINHYEVTQAGWYTLQHVFYDQGGSLAVDLNLLDADGNVLFTETRFNAADLIPAEVGGNRYGWFTFINVVDGINVDDHQLILPQAFMPTGKATFGFVAKYKKGAQTPDGNTEFQFKAADLNFHSTSYEWLVVTGSNFARFKGVGTINGEGAYKFQIWAGDGDPNDPNDPDTFRIKIWEEIGQTESVIYDNGMNQEISGGNIVVHATK